MSEGTIESADHLALIKCFISFEKWVKREKYPTLCMFPSIKAFKGNKNGGIRL